MTNHIDTDHGTYHIDPDVEMDHVENETIVSIYMRACVHKMYVYLITLNEQKNMSTFLVHG